ncbi:MAG TPA: molybdate ABC transporter substrate-binding protein [Nitriliruptorales bacterium]
MSSTDLTAHCHRRVRAWGLAVAAGALVLGAAACGSDAQAVTHDGPLLIAGASDLMPAFTALGEAFESATGEQVAFNFGSSGQLAQQLIEGAPMDLYASANVSFVQQVLDAGVGDPATQATYAFGRITIWSPDDAWRDWRSLDDVAHDEHIRIIAIANPEHAPYGLAAKQALETAGLWDTVEPKLVYGENVSDTQRLAATGNADVAIVALSLALAADQAGDGQWTLLDQNLHAPLQQDLVVVAQDPGRAQLAGRFIDYVNSEDGRQVMRRFGFLLPGEQATGVLVG